MGASEQKPLSFGEEERKFLSGILDRQWWMAVSIAALKRLLMEKLHISKEEIEMMEELAQRDLMAGIAEMALKGWDWKPPEGKRWV